MMDHCEINSTQNGNEISSQNQRSSQSHLHSKFGQFKMKLVTQNQGGRITNLFLIVATITILCAICEGASYERVSHIKGGTYRVVWVA